MWILGLLAIVLSAALCCLVGWMVDLIINPFSTLRNPCRHDLFSGWARLSHIQTRSLFLYSAYYEGTVSCYEGKDTWRTVKDYLTVPLDGYPDKASPDALAATGQIIRALCPPHPRFKRMAIMPIWTRPDGSPIIIAGRPNVVASIGFEDEITIQDRFAYVVGSGDSADRTLWVPLRTKSTSGAIILLRLDRIMWPSQAGPAGPRARTRHVFNRTYISDRDVTIVAREYLEGATDPHSSIWISTDVREVPPALLPGEDDTCGICLNAAEKAVDTVTRCRHWFHGDCLWSWLGRHSAKRECPMCFQPIVGDLNIS